MFELLFFWILPIIGIVYIIGYSLIFDPLRNAAWLPGFFRDLLACPMCIAFYVGLFVGFMNWLPIAWPPGIQLPAIGAVSAIAIEYTFELARRRSDAPQEEG